ncbi:MAG: nucleotidyltransferase family protein [Hyphomicrobium sp.]|nr:nucleotidyltransferase family protein [Hyphomicrobium sp.]
MVLGAGLGKRMRPLTDVIPKPLVRLAGKPLIDHVLDGIARAGIATAVVNVHYMADSMIAHLATRTSPAIVISDEREVLLETGGGVVKALPLLGGTPFLIHNSDTVWIEGVGSNLERLIAAWDAERMDSLLLLAPVSQSIGYDGHGDFNMEATGHVTRRQERREAPFVFAGVSIAHPRLFDGAPDGAFSLNLVWNRAIERDRLYGVRLEGTWMHVGDPSALEAAEARIALETA